MSPFSILLLSSAIFGVLQAQLVLTKHKLKDYKHKFASYDKDSDGQLSFSETREMEKEIGQHPWTDDDESGTIDLIEFMKAQDEEMKKTLSKDKVKAYKQAFDFIDKDGDGKITLTEMSPAMRDMNPTVDQQRSLIHIVDADDNETVDFSEFILANMFEVQFDVEVTNDPLSESRDTFYAIDGDRDGKLTLDELSKLMTSGTDFSEDKLHAMFNELDTDGNQYVDIDEFNKVLMEKNKQREAEEKKAKELKASFSYVDKDNNGEITEDELSTVMTSHHLYSEPELQDIRHRADSDDNGIIDIDEFRTLMGLGTSFTNTFAHSRAKFYKYDKDVDGKVTADELFQYVKNTYGVELNEDELKIEMENADENFDGKVTYEEFMTI